MAYSRTQQPILSYQTVSRKGLGEKPKNEASASSPIIESTSFAFMRALEWPCRCERKRGRAGKRTDPGFPFPSNTQCTMRMYTPHSRATPPDPLPKMMKSSSASAREWGIAARTKTEPKRPTDRRQCHTSLPPFARGVSTEYLLSFQPTCGHPMFALSPNNRPSTPKARAPLPVAPWAPKNSGNAQIT